MNKENEVIVDLVILVGNSFTRTPIEIGQVKSTFDALLELIKNPEDKKVFFLPNMAVKANKIDGFYITEHYVSTSEEALKLQKKLVKIVETQTGDGDSWKNTD